MTAGVVVGILVVVAGVLGWRHHDAAQDATARSGAVAPVLAWVADDRSDGVNAISSTSTRDCLVVDPVRSAPPQERALRTLTTRLPGYQRRGVVRTIDQGGNLCMLQVSVQRAAEIVVLRVEPSWDRPIQAGAGVPRSVSTRDGEVATGFVAVGARDGWTVVVGWSGPASDVPDRTAVLAAARDEAARW